MISENISHREIHEIILKNKSETVHVRKQRVLDYLIDLFNLSKDEEGKKELTVFMRTHFFHIYFNKWRSSIHINECFLYKNKWLDKKIKFPSCIYRNLFITNNIRSRPQKKFDECSEGSKRRKTEILRISKSIAELSYAASMNLRAMRQLQNLSKKLMLVSLEENKYYRNGKKMM